MDQSFVALVAILGVAFYIWTSLKVAAARQKFSVPAPATTGHPEFERTFRVQMNTLEQLPLFLVGLHLCATFVAGWLAALLGLAWIGGRYLYAVGYIEAPERRSLGFGVAAVAALAMLGLALLGVIWSFFA